MRRRNLKFRVASFDPADLEGVEQLKPEEITSIGEVIGVRPSGNQLFIDLNPNPAEGKAILKRHPESKNLNRILNKYGFLSPAVIIIEDYVDFFMIRYETGHSENQVREGLWAEKAFHILLQTMGLYFNYPEPIRDWRLLKPVDFYIPRLGAIEVKSVRKWKDEHNVNINIRDFNKKPEPDYIVAIERIMGTKYLQLVGMMAYTQFKTYKCEEYARQGFSPFWSIPASDFAGSISPRKLYKTLSRIKMEMDSLPKISTSQN
jgi:hypothetical protein